MTFKMLPKWQNFAKPGRIASNTPLLTTTTYSSKERMRAKEREKYDFLAQIFNEVGWGLVDERQKTKQLLIAFYKGDETWSHELSFL